MSRILIIDSDLGLLEVLQAILSHRGYRTTTYKSTENILGLMLAHHPDLLILNYAMKGVTGTELCAEVKHDPAYQKTPVILYSYYNQLPECDTQYRPDLHLQKPVNLLSLTQHITKLLQPETIIH